MKVDDRRCVNNIGKVQILLQGIVKAKTKVKSSTVYRL